MTATENMLPAVQPMTVAGMGALVPVVIADAGERAQWRYVEFFTVTIRNPNTRTAYARACAQFLAWCEGHGLALSAIQPVHVAAWVEVRRVSALRPRSSSSSPPCGCCSTG